MTPEVIRTVDDPGNKEEKTLGEIDQNSKHVKCLDISEESLATITPHRATKF